MISPFALSLIVYHSITLSHSISLSLHLPIAVSVCSLVTHSHCQCIFVLLQHSICRFYSLSCSVSLSVYPSTTLPLFSVYPLITLSCYPICPGFVFHSFTYHFISSFTLHNAFFFLSVASSLYGFKALLLYHCIHSSFCHS